MACLSCGRGFHSECEDGCFKCHPENEAEESLARTIRHAGVGKGAPIKDPEDVKDPLSTGRKRAAQLYPIFPDQPCEWRGKKNCGGGQPIVGCIDGFQRHCHHGPVKNTLRNEPGNVHRICHKCHNRWHAVNNPIYDENLYNTLPHAPEDASEMELLANEAYWSVK